jgi:hypothetical protein
MAGSLQCPYDKQILTTKDFYELTQEDIQGIKHFYMSHVDITEADKELKEHFSNYIQIPYTRKRDC